jgi:hypothetical protein
MNKFDWQRVVASTAGPKSPTIRHVLLTLSIYMQADGSSCFPSFGTLAKATGLSRRSIYRSIGEAEADGWLKVKHQKMGNGFHSNRYTPIIPIRVGTEDPHGRDTHSLPRDKDSLSVGTENHKAGTQGSPNRYINELNNNDGHCFLLKDGSEYHIDGDFYQVLKTTYPAIDIDSELKKLIAWCYANPKKRKTRSGAKRFVNAWIQRIANGNGSRPQALPSTPPKEFDFENQFKGE